MPSRVSQPKRTTNKIKKSKPRTKKSSSKVVSMKRKKSSGKLQRNDKANVKKSHTNNKVISQKKVQSYRKKRKKRKSVSNKEAMMKQSFHSLVALPLAAGDSKQSFALVPITDRQIAEAVRKMAKYDQARSQRAKADPDFPFEWNSDEESIKEQVEEIFSFRVEPGDVSVKPEVWAKITRTMPENFVIPDPELTTFFDNMNVMQAEGEQMIVPEQESFPEEDSTQKTLIVTDDKSLITFNDDNQT